MAESAALLVDEVLPHVPVRQWVISFPFQLRYFFARYPKAMSQALAIVYRIIATHLIKKAGLTHNKLRKQYVKNDMENRRNNHFRWWY